MEAVRSTRWRQRPADLLYPAAFLGAHIAFIPLFAILLPRRVAAVDPDNAVRLLSVLLITGGLIASVAHILAGRWSDRWLRRHGSRRGLIAIGLAVLLLSQIALGFAYSPSSLLMAIIAFQIALNLMFAPLGALLTDYIPDERKGRVAGLLNASLPLASIATSLAAFIFPRDGPMAFLLVGAISAAAVTPLILWWPFRGPLERPTTASAPRGRLANKAFTDYVHIWSARLLIQLGAAFVINFFYLYLEAGRSGIQASRQLGLMATSASIVSFVGAILAGYWSDATGRRRPPMLMGALTCAAGLFALASGYEGAVTVAAFVLFHIGLMTFLAVDFAMVTQLVGQSDRRAELLGWMNLTNTLPAIIVAATALGTSGSGTRLDWPLSFAAAALLSLGAFFLVLRVRVVA